MNLKCIHFHNTAITLLKNINVYMFIYIFLQAVCEYQIGDTRKGCPQRVAVNKQYI